MNKSELVREIANNAGITLKDAGMVFDSVVVTITEALKKGEKIQISGFGTFEVKEKAAREGLNPKTQEKISHWRCMIRTLGILFWVRSSFSFKNEKCDGFRSPKVLLVKGLSKQEEKCEFERVSAPRRPIHRHGLPGRTEWLQKQIRRG